jgi:hypothetical protein
MTDCTRCGGTGQEPDPLQAAYDALVGVIDAYEGVSIAPAAAQNLRHTAAHLHRMAEAVLADAAVNAEKVKAS